MILVLAGTSEGRAMARSLEMEGRRVMASTVTAYGRELLRRHFKGEILSGPLDLGRFLEVIQEKGIDKIIDATHPHAAEIKALAVEACRRAGIVYERLERDGYAPELNQGVILVHSAAAAADLASSFSGNIFLTVGSKSLETYVEKIDPARLVVRVLPLLESLEKCLRLGIMPEHIIAMQGPFAYELERILYRRYRAEVIVAKESGPAGGTPDKIKAAIDLGLPAILIARPG